MQPYLLLHLDIYPEAVRTIEDALKLFSAPETLEGYRTSSAGKVYMESCCLHVVFRICFLHICLIVFEFLMFAECAPIMESCCFWFHWIG